MLRVKLLWDRSWLCWFDCRC